VRIDRPRSTRRWTLHLAALVAAAALVAGCGITPEDSPRNIQEGRLPDSLRSTTTTP
jgi:hypothetical protein